MARRLIEAPDLKKKRKLIEAPDLISKEVIPEVVEQSDMGKEIASIRKDISKVNKLVSRMLSTEPKPDANLKGLADDYARIEDRFNSLQNNNLDIEVVAIKEQVTVIRDWIELLRKNIADLVKNTTDMSVSTKKYIDKRIATAMIMTDTSVLQKGISDLSTEIDTDVATHAALPTVHQDAPALIAIHEAVADPHTGYRLESADHTHQTTGAQAGKLDHGVALLGLTDDDHTQYTKHSLATAVNDFLVASGVGVFIKKTLAEVKTLLGIATDIGTHSDLTTGVHGVGAGTVVANPLLADLDFATYKAVAMTCDNGATVPTSPAPVAGQWFLHTPTGRKVLMQYDGSNWINLASIGTMTVYVDKTDGTDSIDKGGAVDAGAFASVQYAVDRIPGLYGGNVIIYINAEAYDETVTIQGKMLLVITQ